MNMLARLVAATGAVLLWAYARVCRERNLTQRRLARVNLLRAVPARPGRTGSSRGDRPVEIPPTRSSAQRLDTATTDAVTMALHDAGGEWWREDSADRYPGRGGDKEESQ